MKRYLVRSVLAVAAVVSFAAPASAQLATERGTPAISLTPYVGYMVFGDFLDGPLGTSLSSDNAMVFGGQVGLGLTKNIALVGNVAYGESKWSVRVPILGGISLGDANVLLYDAGLQLMMPVGTGGITPFLQGGAGAMKLSVDNSLVKTSGTNFVGNVGAGVDVQLARAIGLRLMAKDYIGKVDFQEATGIPVEGDVAHNFVLSAGVKIGF